MKQTENQKDSALLPNNTMQLLDGRFLPLYPREEKGCETNNEMYIASIKPYQSSKRKSKELSTSEDDTLTQKIFCPIADCFLRRCRCFVVCHL